MTLIGKTIALLAFVCVAAPAFAHGGHGGMTMGGNRTSTYQQTQKSTNHGQTMSTKNHGKPFIVENVISHLRSLIKMYEADLQSGHKGDARRVLEQIGQTSRLLAGHGFTDTTMAGTSHTFETGLGVQGRVSIDGKIVRI